MTHSGDSPSRFHSPKSVGEHEREIGRIMVRSTLSGVDPASQIRRYVERHRGDPHYDGLVRMEEGALDHHSYRPPSYSLK